LNITVVLFLVTMLNALQEASIDKNDQYDQFKIALFYYIIDQ